MFFFFSYICIRQDVKDKCIYPKKIFNNFYFRNFKMIIQKLKKVLLFAILIVSLFALITNKSEAQCPAGATYIEMTFNINGCDYKVPVCYKCEPTGLYHLTIFPLSAIIEVDTNCTPDPAITDIELRNTINSLVVNRILYQQLCEIPPCSTSTVTMLFREYACWRWNRTNGSSIEACISEPLCETVHEICWENNRPVITNVSGSWIGGSPTCPPPPLGDIPNPGPGTISSCFRLKNTCP